MRIRLSEKDSASLGCPEILEWQPTLSQVEAETLQEVFGVDPEDFDRWREGKPAEVDGDTRYRRSARVYRFVMWSALRRVGIKLDPLGFDFDLMGLTFFGDPEPEATEPEGKDPSTPPDTSAT
jgi:hypothetical protein